MQLLKVTANLAGEQISRCFCICQGFPRAQEQMMLQEREVKASTRAGLKLEEEWAEHHRREQREMEIINRQNIHQK